MRRFFKLWTERRKLNKLYRGQVAYIRSEKCKNLSSEEQETEWDIFYQTEYMPLSDSVRAMESEQFLSKLRRYRIPYPDQWSVEGEKYWDQGQEGTYYLSTEGYHQLIKLLREEQKSRRDMVLGWAVPVITALTGLLGGVTAILTIVRYWNK